MKEFTAKTVEEAVAEACQALGVKETALVYGVKEEKKGLFKKSATIEVYEIEDASAYIEEYLRNALKALGVEATTESNIEEDVIKVTIDSPRNPIIIGKNGKTLQALNEVAKVALSTKFRHRYRVVLDVGGYKEDRYARIARIARRVAHDVVRSHVDVSLDPMTPDERRVVHNTLSNYRGVKTESFGEGPNRAVHVEYVPEEGEEK